MTERSASVSQPGRSIRGTGRRLAYDLTRYVREAEATWFVLLLGSTLLCLLMSFIFHDTWPLSVYLIPLLLGMNVMSFPRLLVLDAVTACCLGISLTMITLTLLRLLGIVVILVGAVIVTLHARSRTKLGILPLRGDSMLIDLRDRLASQSQLPVLPRAWRAEAVMRSAGGASFSGDFIVSSKTSGDRWLEIVVVDVSGKGLDAGTRSLQLSSAFGGLLGSLPREGFLTAANQYLLRQEWNEGFATAVHLAVDLENGDFELRTAGHPPGVQFLAGSGRWVPLWTRGPVLGVVRDAEYSVHQGQMHEGDALLLYTDGLVESPSRDIVYGIDKLLGEAERLVQEGFTGGAERLVATVKSETDDRALLLLHRN